jgi:predicted molibdopterin-dependent oxidoreductase YjgC
VAFLGGEKLNVEEAYLFQKLARAVLKTNHIDARTRFTTRVGGAAILKATGGGRPLMSFDDSMARRKFWCWATTSRVSRRSRRRR